MMTLLLPLLSLSALSPTRILVAWHTETNRTGDYAALVSTAAAAEPNTIIRAKHVSDVTCDDLKWFHGVALGSPVYWGMYSGVMKAFLDNVQQRCFSWPVAALRWKVGAAFATGAHVSSGKEATIAALHTFYYSVQMVAVANEPASACLMGACATNRNESAAVPTFTDAERTDAQSLARRLVRLSTAMRGLMESEAGAPPAAAV